jgi:hypothetical protein
MCDVASCHVVVVLLRDSLMRNGQWVSVRLWTMRGAPLLEKNIFAISVRALD